MIRLFIAEATPPFTEGLIFPLNPDQGRYVAAVMRQEVGDEISVFNGRDGEWRGRLQAVSKKHVHVELIERTRVQPVTAHPPKLLIALVKRARLETIIEKATELGVGDIQLLITRRTNADHTNVGRLQLIAQEAAEQTERLDVPEVLPPVKLEAWLKSATGTVIYGDEDSTHETGQRTIPPMSEALTGLGEGAVAILIGPEGGFDDFERETLRGWPQARAVNLGPRILRADTAAIAALTLYQAICGDWK
ncbi:16S rRNA (uracil(1498)-N(3))-methyltransferase [Asticcacaulis sp. BYS171W]|uniref:Ribosomal RNA small subunit methyltransferase E n=1 Tax=Asticcacaulis aquaticus TaxID=2984212 RepID=A0ABT5HYU8_9CAUL|nr:16S rRNA (uracil(1498)-N(3))-methyltransferase [Asticcacaulis aquaticus]MDC7685203.1 16S rRNA (uracil(1498)-N(3))-methyltransferase [Asticcacaulis aquaticus]